MKKWLGWMLLAGCATSPGTLKGAASGPGPLDARETAAASRVRAALEALPRCEAGAPVGVLTLRPTVCTKMFCEEACCNQCGWAATFEGKDGQPVPVEPARVQALLGVPESALECEIAAWAGALAGQSVSVDPPACVVR